MSLQSGHLKVRAPGFHRRLALKDLEHSSQAYVKALQQPEAQHSIQLTPVKE